jgi:hypothetical protein
MMPSRCTSRTDTTAFAAVSSTRFGKRCFTLPADDDACPHLVIAVSTQW